MVAESIFDVGRAYIAEPTAALSFDHLVGHSHCGVEQPLRLAKLFDEGILGIFDVFI